MAHIKAAYIISEALSNLLNKKIDKITVYNEMFLIEHGQEGEDKVLSLYIKQMMFDYMEPKTQADKTRLKQKIECGI